MYDVPQEKPKEQVMGNSREYPTNEDSLKKAISEIDLALVKEAFVNTNVAGIFNKLKLKFNSKHRQTVKIQLYQIDFLLTAQKLLKHKEINYYVYAILGAFQYVTGRWGEFPSTGPLFELKLKKDDLLQVISANMPDIKLEHLFKEPNLISHRADNAFTEFLSQHPELHNLT